MYVVTTGISRTAVADSSAIFKFFDQTKELEHPFYPTGSDATSAYATLENQATIQLDAYVSYYAWIYTPAHESTIMTAAHKTLPAQWVSDCYTFLACL